MTDGLIVNGSKIACMSERDPAEACPGANLEADYVVESTGLFTAFDAASASTSRPVPNAW